MAYSSDVDILVVDDYPENILAIESILETVGVNIVKAHSGKEALLAVLNYEFALILLDVQMPGMDGFETAELLRSRPKTSKIPIIFVTAISKEQSHVFKGYEAGAVDYLFKPFDPVILKSKVRVFVELFSHRRELEKTKFSLQQLNRRLEERVQQKTLDLQAKADELQRANQRLVELDEMKTAFLSSVSHELRTPLTSVMGFAKLIDKDFLKSIAPLATSCPVLTKKCNRIHENLVVIGNEGERLTRLINDVLDLNRIETGNVIWNDVELSPNEIIAQSLRAVDVYFLDRPDVKLITDFIEDLPCVVADRDKLEQVLINLLDNASKFTRKGFIAVRARITHDGYLIVMVEDSGEGIPPKDLDKVFENFHQVKGDTLHNKPRGTGLGLAICRQIIQHYGGRIWVESQLGRGSTFNFTLPLAAPGQPGSSHPPCCPHSQGGGLALVADHDYTTSLELSELISDCGFSVVNVYDCSAALEKARLFLPDCILLETLLLDMADTDIIKAFRTDPELKDIPIIFLSPSAAMSINNFITLQKPVTADQLKEALVSVLGSDRIKSAI